MMMRELEPEKKERMIENGSRMTKMTTKEEETETEIGKKESEEALFAAKESTLDDLAGDMEVFLGGKDKESWRESLLEAVKDVVPSGSKVTYTHYSQAVIPEVVSIVFMSMSVGDAPKSDEIEYTGFADAEDGVEFRPGGTETQNKPVVLDVGRSHRIWRTKEADRMSELQARYEKLLGDKAIPFYQELKGGELFEAKGDVHYRVYKGKLEDEKNSVTGYGFVNWEWEKVSEGDVLMFVYQKKDEDGEITPRWIITDMKTGEPRIRELYIASSKLQRMQIREEKE